MRVSAVVLGAALLTASFPGRVWPTAPPVPREFTVTLHDGKAGLPPGMCTFWEILGGGARRGQPVKQGAVQLGRETFTLYLRVAKTYPLQNKGKNDGYGDNTSAMLAIDQRGKGNLGLFDAWFVNLPIRLGDRMFQVVRIGPNGNSITLRPTRAPLCGVVVGRACPDFTFQTADGRTITRDAYKGKAFLLDIWSVT